MFTPLRLESSPIGRSSDRESVMTRIAKALDPGVATGCTVPPCRSRKNSATLLILGAGYWLVYRSSKLACAPGVDCRRPRPRRLIKVGLILATIVVIAALGFDVLAPLILSS